MGLQRDEARGFSEETLQESQVPGNWSSANKLLCTSKGPGAYLNTESRGKQLPAIECF